MKRHVVLTLGRSGSNTLVNLINQHPDLLNIGEVLGPWNKVRQIRDACRLYRGDTAAYLDAVTRSSGLLRVMSAGRSVQYLARLRPRQIKPLRKVRSLGFKEFATLMEEQGQSHWLQQRPDVHVIGLVRDDILGRFISWQLLDQTGVVAQNTKSRGKPHSLYVDPDRIGALLERIAWENRLLQDMLAALPQERVYTIPYSDFYRDEASRTQIMDDVFSFLGVKTFPTDIRMKKIVTVPPAQVITNREACAEALCGTPFEGILD